MKHFIACLKFKFTNIIRIRESLDISDIRYSDIGNFYFESPVYLDVRYLAFSLNHNHTFAHERVTRL